MIVSNSGIYADGMTHDEVLFYSPVQNLITVKTRFKRPQQVLEKLIIICPRCSLESLTTIHLSTGKRFLQIHRSVCINGHVEVAIKSVLNHERSKSRA